MSSTDGAASPPHPFGNALASTVWESSAILWRCFIGPVAVATAITSFLCLVVGRYWTAAALSAAIVLKGFLAWLAVKPLQLHAQKLQHSTLPSQAVVWRGGVWSATEAEELRVGDVLRVDSGTRVIPADCVVMDGVLTVDTAPINGRSLPVVVATPDQLLYTGTRVVEGNGTLQVKAVGPQSHAGQIISLLPHLYSRPPSVLRHVLLSIWTAFFIFNSAIGMIVFGGLSGSSTLGTLTVIAEVLLLSLLCFPSALDLGVVTATARVATELHQATCGVLTRLSALVTLASVDVFLMDKSGTLTTGAYVVSEEYRLFTAQLQRRAELVRLAALALRWREPTYHEIERAILRCADLDDCDSYTQLSFAEHRPQGYSSAVVVDGNGAPTRVAVGSVEAVLQLSEEEGSRAPEEVMQVTLSWRQRGQRCIGVAAVFGSGPLSFVGLLSLIDPLKSDVEHTMDRCRALGVAVKMVSGDEAPIVAAVGRRLRLGAMVLTGSRLPVAEVWRGQSSLPSVSGSSMGLYNSCCIYAEMSAEQKVVLVRLLQQEGHVVAMIGDGLNDAPAVKSADVGIALTVAELHDSYSPDTSAPFLASAAPGSALWGADLILPSNRLGVVADTLVFSRQLFAVLHYLVFHATTVSLQFGFIAAAEVLLMPKVCKTAPSWSSHASAGEGGSLPMLPSAYHAGPLVLVWVLCAAVQGSYHRGPDAGARGVVCRWNVVMLVLPASGMALVGAMGILGFNYFLFKTCADAATMRKSFLGLQVHSYEMASSVVCAELCLSTVFLSASCTSLQRWGFSSAIQRGGLMGCVVFVLFFLALATDLSSYASAVLVLIVAVICLLQDGLKMTLHVLFYHCNGFQYRHTVDGATASIWTSSIEAAAEERAMLEDSSGGLPATAARPLHQSSDIRLEMRLGCLDVLEEPFFSAV